MRNTLEMPFYNNNHNEVKAIKMLLIGKSMYG